MEYRMRYSSRELECLHFKDIESAFLGDLVQPRKVYFDKVSTIFSVIDGEVVQYSTASKQGLRMDSNNYFNMGMTDKDLLSNKYDDFNLFRSEEEILNLIYFGTLREYQQKKLFDYEKNNGKVIHLDYEIGTQAGDEILAGYLITDDDSENHEAIAIMLSEEKWHEFVSEFRKEKTSECLIQYLMER